jgi:hypothetical protein
MKKLFAALALSALVAGPSFAATEKQKENSDAGHKKVDDKAAHNDANAAQALFKRAGEQEREAANLWQAAEKHWQDRAALLQKRAQVLSQARAERLAAIRLSAEAQKLFRAESLRSRALSDRLAADQLFKSAWNHQNAANQAQAAINEGTKAKADLSKNPAFADAIKTIDADMAKETKINADETSKAKADREFGDKLMASAAKIEGEANALEKPVVVVPAVKVAPPAPPKPIVIQVVAAPKK